MSHKRVPVYDPTTGAMTWGWSENESWGPARATTMGYYRGEIVVGERGQAKPVATGGRVEPPPCAAEMPRVKKICARPLGHKDEHLSLDAYLGKLARRRARAA